MEKDIFTINKASFEQIYLQHWEGMFAYCLKNIQDEDLAKEIVQEVFKSLWERREKLEINEVDRYLIRSVKLKTFEYIRNRQTRQQHHEKISIQTQTHYSEDHLVTDELSIQITKLINNLPKQCKNVFNMSRNQGLTNKEIARQLYISERAVEYHISKALHTLRIELDKYIH